MNSWMTSTLLSLLIIPSVFEVMDDLEHLMKRGVARMRGHKPNDTEFAAVQNS